MPGASTEHRRAGVPLRWLLAILALVVLVLLIWVSLVGRNSESSTPARSVTGDDFAMETGYRLEPHSLA